MLPDGLELPARAIVRSSAADSGGYRATVEILTGDGKRTDQVLPDLPIDRQWVAAAGAGIFAPPAPDQLVMVTWSGGSAGHPVVTCGADDEPAVPFRAVPGGGWALQDGQGSELRLGPDGTWTLRDRAGAEVAVDLAHLWRIASVAESLHVWLTDLVGVLQDAATVLDTDTAAGSAGRELGYNAATLAALAALLPRLDNLLRP